MKDCLDFYTITWGERYKQGKEQFPSESILKTVFRETFRIMEKYNQIDTIRKPVILFQNTA